MTDGHGPTRSRRCRAAVDGQENPLEVFMMAKIHKLGQQYVTKWNYSNDPLVFAVYDRTSTAGAETKKIVREAAIEAAGEQVDRCASIRRCRGCPQAGGRSARTDRADKAGRRKPRYERPKPGKKQTNPKIAAMIEQVVKETRAPE
ncbi:MAG: hypothetical protein R3E68_11905 [Burkholderiaceae bacterium]